MKTIVFSNQKGGTGKSTLAILLAAALTQCKRNVAIWDTDPLNVSSEWANKLEINVYKPNETYDFLIIDTPAGSPNPIAIEKADLILVPTSPSPADQIASATTAKELPRNKSYLVFNLVVPKTQLAKDIAAAADRIGLKSLTNVVHRRVCYQYAIMLGWAELNSEAKEEILSLAVEVASTIN